MMTKNLNNTIDQYNKFVNLATSKEIVSEFSELLLDDRADVLLETLDEMLYSLEGIRSYFNTCFSGVLSLKKQASLSDRDISDTDLTKFESRLHNFANPQEVMSWNVQTMA